MNAIMSCDTKNVIYVITFPECNEFYIGERETLYVPVFVCINDISIYLYTDK